MAKREATRAPGGRFKKALKLFGAGLFASVALCLVTNVARADEANVQADSDGYVPVYYSCWAGGEAGTYTWTYDGYATYGVITINKCLLDSLGAGPMDYQRVIAHEMGHAAGLPHSTDPSSVMYPVTTITGSRRRYVKVPAHRRRLRRRQRLAASRRRGLLLLS